MSEQSQIVPRESLSPAPTLELANERCTRLLLAEERIVGALHQLCICLWDFGQTLTGLKELVPHGQWGLYVVNHFPQLGEEEKTRTNRAQDAMAFFAANPKYPDIGVFTPESIRKCVFHLAPEKERPQLPGDAPIAPAVTHLTFVNQFSKYARRIAANLEPAPDPEIFRREIEPALKGIIDIAGSDYVRSLL